MINDKREIAQKIKVGDILLNEHATETNPLRKTIVVGCYATLVVSVYYYKGFVKKCRYRTYDVKYDKSFKVVGHVDLKKIFMDILNK